MDNIDNKETNIDKKPIEIENGIKNGIKNITESNESTAPKPSYDEWMKKFAWSKNPFTLVIDSNLLVGYKKQISKIIEYIDEGKRLIFLKGPTGSGKTTLLKFIENSVSKKYKVIFLAKPPTNPNEFVEIFKNAFPTPWFLRPFISNIKNVYQIPNFVNKKLQKKRLVILLDEIHEASTELLEWIRVFVDQIDDVVIILSGLPSFEMILREKLETLEKRISSRIEVLSLTKEETKELIEKRIKNVGGTGLGPFNDEIIEKIFKRTNGFPRDTLKICGNLVEELIETGKYVATPDMLSDVSSDKKKEKYNISFEILYNLSPRQQEIVEILAKNDMTPGQISNMVDLKEYKSRQHAIRSINNILQRLVQEGYVERRKIGKSFIYTLMPKIKNMLIGH